jgi:glutathione S-transferase
MALAYAGVIYELREVSLKNKPKEMLDISPKGTTPVLQIFKQSFKEIETSTQDLAQNLAQNFIVLEESLDIMNWAIAQNDPLNWMALSENALAIAKQLITTNDREFKQALDRYKYANRFPERSPEFYRQQAEEFLQVLELQLQEYAGFLVSDRQTLADVAIFPFVRQMAYVDIDWFRSSDYRYLQTWLTWHETSSLFELVMQKFPVFDSAVRYQK